MLLERTRFEQIGRAGRFERSEQDRNKAETLNSIGERGNDPSFDWFPDAVGNQFRPPPLPVSTDPDYKSWTSCCLRCSLPHFGPLCGIKNVPRIFSSTPTVFLFLFFSRYREIRGSENTRLLLCSEKRGVEEKLYRREGIRLFDESFIYCYFCFRPYFFFNLISTNFNRVAAMAKWLKTETIKIKKKNLSIRRMIEL